MFELSCPACGAPVTFRNRVSTFAVCSHCHSELLRTDLRLEQLGKMAVLQEDYSALQLFTSGRYKNRSFLLIGRIRLAWERGQWDEWAMFFDGSAEGWLAEAQGQYMVSFPVPPERVVLADSPSVGSAISLDGNRYSVKDLKTVKCIFSEGELPFKAVLNQEFVSIDLNGENGGFGSLTLSEGSTVAFRGEYQRFDELALTNLRQLPGW